VTSVGVIVAVGIDNPLVKIKRRVRTSFSPADASAQCETYTYPVHVTEQPHDMR